MAWTNQSTSTAAESDTVIAVRDDNFSIVDDADTTKALRFSVGGITTATTRTLTVPDVTDTIVTLAATQTLTNKTLTAPVVGGNLTLSSASEIQNSVGTQYIRLNGGANGAVGGNVIVFGATHASAANTVQVNGSAGVNITGPTTVTGNLGVGTSTFGTSATSTLALFNGTVPSTSPADTVQLFSADISAGNASLGIRTETAVVTESVVSDRTLSVTINGTIYKICLKA